MSVIRVVEEHVDLLVKGKWRLEMNTSLTVSEDSKCITEPLNVFPLSVLVNPFVFEHSGVYGSENGGFPTEQARAARDYMGTTVSRNHTHADHTQNSTASCL